MQYAPALLSYAVIPNFAQYSSDPASPSTVLLMIVATNWTSQAVDCLRLVFALPVGTGASELTADPGLQAQAVLGTPWTIVGDGSGNFTATPEPPASGVASGDSIAFVIGPISINEVPGLAEISIYEGGSPTRETQVAVSKVQPGLAITSLTANPIAVAPGSQATLAWTSTGADSASLSWAGASIPVAPSGLATVMPASTTTYTLAVAGGAASASQQVTIVVPRPGLDRTEDDRWGV